MVVTKSPDLELISENIQSESHATEKRRLPRLYLSTEQFRLKPNGKIFPVIDLSEEGMGLGLLDHHDLQLFPLANLIEGTLKLAGEKFDVQMKVKHLRSEFVGCHFEVPSEQLMQALRVFLDPKRLGSELRPIPVPSVEGTIWFHGSSGADLLLSREMSGNCRRFSLYILGSYIQWESNTGLSTGRAQVDRNQSELQGILRLQTLILHPDPVPDAGKLDIAKILLVSSNLPQDLKNWCIRQIESGDF